MYLRLLTTIFAFNLFFYISDLKAADVTIEMLNKNKETKQRMVYSQELVKIEKGQTIEWIPTAKAHNVEILVAPEGYTIPKKTKLSEKVTMTFEVPGIYLYQCSPHAALGMIGLIVVGGDTSNKEAILKEKLVGSKSKKKRDKLVGEI